MSHAVPILPILPPLVPQFPRSRRSRFCSWMLKRSGWRLVGEFPNLPKLVVIAAPHSSVWDGIWGLLMRGALGINVNFMVKSELFWWPFGILLRRLGAIATDRSAPHGVVGQMVQLFQSKQQFWLAIAPEGTRKKVAKWKSGFWHIARDVGVSVLPIYFHYPEKIIGIGPLIELSDDLNVDMQRIRAFYVPWQGKFHDTL